MSEENTDTQLAEKPLRVKDLVELPAVQARFQNALGPVRAPKFISALVSISMQSNLANCDAKSIISSALVAATLDLPIEKQLGFAHIVPYAGVAQFQMAAKGYIQLALRSGQYQRINAKPVNAEAVGSYDEVGEPIIDWSKLDETKEAVGYVVAWRLNNGFTKIAYWTKAKVEAHAQKFSKAYAAKKKDSPWFTSFDKMALKTIVMNELRAWGILSVEMQTAIKHDGGAQLDLDADVDYIDNDQPDQNSSDESGQPVTNRPPPPQRTPKGAGAMKNVTPAPAASSTPPAPVTDPKPAAEPAKEAPKEPAKAADPKPVAPVEPAKTVAPAPAPAPAPSTPVGEAPKKPRTTPLADKEEMIAICTPEKVFAMIINVAGQPTPSIQAAVVGDYVGGVFQFGGALKTGDAISAPPVWAVGGKVKLSLVGKFNQKNKQLMCVVNAIEPYTEADSANQSMDVD